MCVFWTGEIVKIVLLESSCDSKFYGQQDMKTWIAQYSLPKNRNICSWCLGVNPCAGRWQHISAHL